MLENIKDFPSKWRIILILLGCVVVNNPTGFDGEILSMMPGIFVIVYYLSMFTRFFAYIIGIASVGLMIHAYVISDEDEELADKRWDLAIVLNNIAIILIVINVILGFVSIWIANQVF